MQLPSEPRVSSLSGSSTSVSMRPVYPVVLLRVLARSGYGVWMLLGAALVLGIYRDGRNAALVPLAIGTVFVSAGLLASCLRLPSTLDWHGWYPGRGSRPTREALLALATYLPMLAAAGLVRGGNDFWATRLAGAGLMLCSLANLTYVACRDRDRLTADLRRMAATLPLNRVVAAGYSGGLWLWLCLAAQDDKVHPAGTHPWIMVLVALALLLGLIEALRWQSLHPRTPPMGQDVRSMRFVASAFTYALPCVALLLDDLFDAGALVVAVAAVSCLLGKTIEQRLYEATLERLDACPKA
jgi:hypothetical protein